MEYAARNPVVRGAPGWPSTPDAAHNAAVAAEAIALVRSKLGEEKRDRQKDNCGWDLEFFRNGRVLCIEVKGLSGAALSVELSPNEYAAMKRVMSGKFSEGDYRLAVVTDALSSKRELFLFAYDGGHGDGARWKCERSSIVISVSERIAARLSVAD